MRGWKCLLFVLVAGLLLSGGPKASAQVSVGIDVGVQPVCPYGYYDYTPYGCAPSGYYGPEWFTGGVFIGAGPWFHGPSGFQGHVDNRYDRQKGYTGPVPERNEKPVARTSREFNGNEMRDGRGNEVRGGDKR